MSQLNILFYLAKPYSLPITQSLREAVAGRHDCNALCFIAESLKPHITDTYATTVLSDAVAFNPAIVFCPGNYVHDAISGIKVQLFHGLGYEKKGHFAIRGFFQVYCTPGPRITGRFQKLAARHKSFLVVETGWPKTDLLFHTAAGPAAFARIPPDKKIILYAPTFSRTLTSVPKIMPHIRALPREDEFFVIKLHDLHDKQEKERLASLPPDRFMVVDSPDSIPWMQAADMLISDTSSVVYEFALIKERILLVEPRQKDLPFIQCAAAHVREGIDTVLHDTASRTGAIRALMDSIHPYRDGLSAQRILDTVTDPAFMAQARALPRKKNWFRKLKLRYYTMFKKGYVK